MAAFEKRVMDRNNEWIYVGDRVTCDDYWTYEVFDIVGGALCLAAGPRQHPFRFRRVSAAEQVDTKGRIVSEANEQGRQRAAQWMEEQNRRNAEG